MKWCKVHGQNPDPVHRACCDFEYEGCVVADAADLIAQALEDFYEATAPGSREWLLPHQAADAVVAALEGTE